MRAMRFFTVLVLGATIAACSSQETYTSAQKIPDLALTENFAPMAASGDKYEVLSSKLALKRSHNAGIRRIAKTLIADHTASTKKMAAILSQDHMDAPPQALMAHHQKSLDILRDATDFDHQYLESQELAHRQAIRMFEMYSDRGDNADLRKFAADTLPTLRKHLDLIRAARSQEQAQ
jgi:putative membrane protein